VNFLRRSKNEDQDVREGFKKGLNAKKPELKIRGGCRDREFGCLLVTRSPLGQEKEILQEGGCAGGRKGPAAKRSPWVGRSGFMNEGNVT